MSNEEHISELIPAYALGALDRNEAREVEAHLPHCPECQAELRRLETIVHDLSLGVADEQPPPELRRRLQERIAPTAVHPDETTADPSLWGQITAVFRQHRALAFTQAALIVLVLVLLAGTLLLWQQVNDLQSGPQPGTLQAIPLQSTGIIPDAQGYLTVSWDGLSGAIVLDRVPQLAEDQVYQLWLVRDGQRFAAAQLVADELGYGGARVNPPQPLYDFSSAEVTVEPAEGSDAPTSAVILRGDLFE